MSEGDRELFREPASSFVTTRWTVVLSARDTVDATSSEAMERLCRTYWAPLYAYLRRQGYPPEDCEDLVQGFFERLIAREFLKDVDRSKGRFRSFLLAALRHYVSNARRGQRTRRRGGPLPIFSLDEPGVLQRCEAGLAGAAAEQVFDRVWATTIMDNAARTLRREYETRGRVDVFEFIRVWLAKEAEPGDYASVAELSGMSEGSIAAAVFRMRRRFRELVREEVLRTVQDPLEVDVEIHHLFRVLTS